jgi:PPOX class probable F420-dependent enzyme
VTRRALAGTAAAMVRDARVARLATVLPDGSPHVVPVCPVLDGDRLVVALDGGVKLRNLRNDPRVALVVDDYVEDWDALRQVVVFGRATLLEDGPGWERGRDAMYAKFEQYEPQAPIERGSTVVVEIAVDRVSTSGV